jgi:hypothetical protein
MRRWPLAALALLLSAALGCGAAKPNVAAQPPPPKPPDDPWSWLPEDATTVGTLQLNQLRRSQLWPIVEREQPIQSWVDLGKVERLTFGGSGQTVEDGSYVAALEGNFAEGELRELAVRDQLAPEQRGLLTLYRRPDSVWTQINAKLIVTCSLDRADALVARAGAGPGTAVKERELYRSLAARVALDSAHLAILADDPEGTRRAALERRAARIGLASVVRDAVRLGVGLEVGAQYRLVAVAEAADGARAQALEADVREKLDALSSNLLVRILGVSKLIGSLHPSSDANYVVLRGDVPEEELNQLLHRLQGAMNLTGSVGPSIGQP